MPNPKSGDLLEYDLDEVRHNPDPDNPVTPAVEEAARVLNPKMSVYEASETPSRKKFSMPSPDPTQIAHLRSQGIEPPKVEAVFGSDLTEDLQAAQRARKHDLSVPSSTTTKTTK